MQKRLAGWTLLLGWVVTNALAAPIDVQPLLKSIRAVEAKGKGNQAAAAAWKTLAQADVAQLPEILQAMTGADTLAQNWIRSAVETIAQRRIQDGGKLPIDQLEAFIANTQHAPRARRLAYELIAKVDPNAESRLIPPLVNDPSLELRRDAVALLLTNAAAIDAKANKTDAVKAYRHALTYARDLEQIDTVAKKLKELGETVDLPTHFGFLLRWKLIGPFDNSNKSGFNVAYPPETELKMDATYTGKAEAKVRWIDHVSQDEHGIVDLNKAIGKNMGAIAYAVTEFHSPTDRDIELRLGCINGNKIWLNGQLLTANHVYHTGQDIDQYTGKGRLKSGRNTILLKIAQNEQTEEWAQNWQFQLRVCDELGTAVLAQDRAGSATSAD